MDIKKTKSKPGPKTGSKHGKTHTNNRWAMCCKTYLDGPKMSQKAFLESELSGPEFSGTSSEIVTFSKKLKAFKNGELKVEAVDFKRKAEGRFKEIEDKVVAYMKLRAKAYVKDKCGLSWNLLKEKATGYAAKLGIPENDFKASDGWLEGVLKRSSMTGTKLHGEAMEMDAEQRIVALNKWKEEHFHPLIEEYNVLPQCIYNADQTGLFYQKLPNRIYVEKARVKDFKGTKQMKDKNRITLMVGTAADGSKIPMSIVGKPKNPACFSMCENGKPPLAYTNQKCGWFDADITMWWLMNVFWPHHTSKFGHSHCILVLDNCPAHKVDTSVLPKELHICFLPPNMTSNHQPADMGMIASLKVGYKSKMLRMLLDVFDGEGGYEAAAKARKQLRRGCRGLEYGGKATILDAMMIIKDIWGKNQKYATEEGIRRCWRKAGILPLAMETEINKALGHSGTPLGEKTLSKEDCDELCSLMKAVRLQTKSCELDTNSVAVALQGSFAGEESLEDEDLMDMVAEWVEVEDDEEMINVIVDEEVELLEAEAVIGVEDDEESDVDMKDTEEEDTMTFLEAEEALRKLTISCKKLGISEAATVHLDRFKKALFKAKAGKKKKNTTIHDFFQPSKKSKNN